ncbi:hypothetical protein B0H14DRAFT_3534578 [Mycena olivaceomarginata]|nr:hypothetical protein B0H14DRAFT_3534578 [Mycena olivaceomarginata]
MNTPQTANGNCCIHCGNQLTVEVAEGGKVPGPSFIRCFNGPIPGKPHYFFRFPPQNRVSALPTMNTAPSATPVVASSAQAVALQANPVRRLCPTPGCGSGRIQPLLPVVIIQEREDDECIPDMIWCEDTSKLPPAGGEIAFLLLR